MINTIESRKMERFDLKLDTRLFLDSLPKKQLVRNLQSNDVSSGGAFFETDEPLGVGTPLKMEMVLPVTELKKHQSKGAIIKVSGAVVRVTSQGMAVIFDEEYQILKMAGEEKRLFS